MIKPDSQQKGFSYIEVLITVVIVGVSLVPAMNALNSSVKVSEVNGNFLQQHYYLFGKMEEVLAESFPDLEQAAISAGSYTSPSLYSDTSGVQQSRVFLSLYDIDNADLDNNAFTGGDDVIWVRTELKGTNLAFETLVTP